MRQFQVLPIPPTQQSFLVQLSRDFRAALSYLSFYSSDSPFVVGAIRKLHKNLQRLLTSTHPLILYRRDGVLLMNGSPLSDTGDLLKIFEEKNWNALLIENGLAYHEWVSWLRHMAFPFEENQSPSVPWEHLKQIDLTDFVLLEERSAEAASEIPEVVTAGAVDTPSEATTAELRALPITEAPIQAEVAFSPESVPPRLSSAQMEETMIPELETPVQSFGAKIRAPRPDEAPLAAALLTSVAEAWHFSSLLKKTSKEFDTSLELEKNYSLFFSHLLDRLDAASPDLKGIVQWFRTSQGDVVDNDAVLAMIPLMELAVRQGWTVVLFDPTTEGLVNDCLGLWGAEGKRDLVEQTVTALSEGLGRTEAERRIALTHLMDARPWVDNPSLLGKVLEQLCRLLAGEKNPSVYQSALLSAWDLVEPALETNNETSALSLLSTLHFHADDDEPAKDFPERASIARHWLFERSTPDLVRRMAVCAHQAGRLDHFPLWGEMAAPLLLDDYQRVEPEEKKRLLKLFGEMGDPLRSVLTERVAALESNEKLQSLIPVLKTAGLDAALSFQLSSWFSKGDRALKLNLIELIEQIGSPEGGPALRLALFDDSEEIASEAARVLGKINFIPSVPVLIKALKLRQSRGPDHEKFAVEVCRALGRMGQAETIPFLEELAKKKPIFRGAKAPMPV
ncbi:MAG: HEAT repeat domain-containing protein, partial [bacterium]